jgi:hypothetical protein
MHGKKAYKYLIPKHFHIKSNNAKHINAFRSNIMIFDTKRMMRKATQFGFSLFLSVNFVSISISICLNSISNIKNNLLLLKIYCYSLLNKTTNKKTSCFSDKHMSLDNEMCAHMCFT